ncbi:hypothetical protein [Beggiatoa leptomitoformis]|uniref:Uncharacterized protein n=1 Tax=Beggiatoa leptomitoformis TaxID=288004 RepID=A0A2N9YFF1_9GAMM|nr:hypothetical protein [Beggiatoa leptomitoformis]ALG68455.1 hypothetical protein AL038_13050 [Beggiatoa leptomitoformis]AUI69212.1 hypothetical protein BLE401_11220 [Beggiatoa leptomitoformis]
MRYFLLLIIVLFLPITMTVWGGENQVYLRCWYGLPPNPPLYPPLCWYELLPNPSVSPDLHRDTVGEQKQHVTEGKKPILTIELEEKKPKVEQEQHIVEREKPIPNVSKQKTMETKHEEQKKVLISDDKTVKEKLEPTQENSDYIKIAGVVLGGFSLIVIIFSLVRRKAKQQTKILIPSHEFLGFTRSGYPTEIDTPFQKKLLDNIKRNVRWDESNTERVKKTLQQILDDKNQANATNQIVIFLMDFWCPFLACYEADTQHWQWFSKQLKTVCPTQWTVEIVYQPLKNKFLSECAQYTDKVIGNGEVVQEICRPAVTLRNETNEIITSRKAWVKTK